MNKIRANLSWRRETTRNKVLLWHTSLPQHYLIVWEHIFLSQTSPKYFSKQSIMWGSKGLTEFLTSHDSNAHLISKYTSCEGPLSSTECSTSNDRSTHLISKYHHARVQRIDGVLDLKWPMYSYILKPNHEREHCAWWGTQLWMI